MWKLRYSGKLESGWKWWIGCRWLGVFNIGLQLDLDIRTLIIILRTNLESGPWFAKVWCNLKSYLYIIKSFDQPVINLAAGEDIEHAVLLKGWVSLFIRPFPLEQLPLPAWPNLAVDKLKKELKWCGLGLVYNHIICCAICCVNGALHKK